MKQLIQLRDKMKRKNYLENAKVINAAIERIERLEEIANAVAHVGVDFGYGKYELQPKIIENARKLLELKNG